MKGLPMVALVVVPVAFGLGMVRAAAGVTHLSSHLQALPPLPPLPPELIEPHRPPGAAARTSAAADPFDIDSDDGGPVIRGDERLSAAPTGGRDASLEEASDAQANDDHDGDADHDHEHDQEHTDARAPSEHEAGRVTDRAGLVARPEQRTGERWDAAHAGREPLEGPPTPLPPAERMSVTTGATGASDVAIVANAANAGERLSERGGASDAEKPISLHFRHAELADVLEAFARFTGLNIVASEKVRGSVSLHLDNVPWRTAFDTLLEVNGLAMARRGNVIWVAPLAELAARERQRFEAHARAAELEPLASRTFELRYPRAEDVARLLTAPGAQRVLSKRGGAMAEPRTNLLFVTDLDARLRQVAALIAEIDRPSRQVFIEARIVEGARGFSRELGARLSVGSAGANGATGAHGAGGDGGTGGTGTSARPRAGSNGLVHDLSAHAISGFDPASVGLTLFAAQATRVVTTALSALEAEGRGQIVSSPRVVTADRTKATVEQGTELPYQAKVRHGISGVQFRRATLKLEVEPQITPNGRVILDLDIAKDSLGETTAAGPAIDTKRVRTRVEVEDGGTVSIGGIYEAHDRNDVTRVPLLGKIPILGSFFRHRTQRERSSELAVFITPRVVEVN